MPNEQDKNQIDFIQYQSQLNDEIELLHEQIASLVAEIKDLNQELEYTKQKMYDLNQENQILSARLSPTLLSLSAAQEFAKQLLISGQPTKQCLAEILSAIYNVPIKPRELQPKRMPQSRQRQQTQKVRQSLRTVQNELHTQLHELNIRLERFRALYEKLNNQLKK